MKETNVALAPIPQSDGRVKPRPVVVLREMPPFGDWLVCGVSTQLQQHVADFDEIVTPDDADFAKSGLKAASLVRLGFLTVIPTSQIMGVIGSISRARHQRLIHSLRQHLNPK
jgi:mRNA interferase MazF